VVKLQSLFFDIFSNNINKYLLIMFHIDDT